MRIYGGTEASSRRVSSIAEVEAEQERVACQRADDKKALAHAKMQGKEAVATVRARIAQEQATASHARQLEKLRITAERKEEKLRIAVEKKERQAEKRPSAKVQKACKALIRAACLVRTAIQVMII